MNSKLFLFVFSALVSYLVAGINPAILLSKMIYHQDIRTLGSKIPDLQISKEYSETGMPGMYLHWIS